MVENKRLVEFNEQYIRLVSPENVLKRGYSLTFKNGKIVKRAAELTVGDEITIQFADGEKTGRVNK
jgi:exodeoxyribonuclease VII large subunit